MRRTVAGAGLVAVAAATALVVIAVGGGFSTTTTAEAASAPSADATASASPSADASATAAPTPSASPTPPSPTPTVKGTVNGSEHTGDLRYFLLPVPSDAQAEGDINGTTMSLTDVAGELSNASESKTILRQYGFHSGAYRSYRLDDGSLEVTVRLIRFGSSADAGYWVSGLSFGKGKSFTPSGVSNAKAVAFDPGDDYGTGSLEGVSHVGDVEYEVDVAGQGKLSHSLLAPLMLREEKRLRTGR